MKWAMAHLSHVASAPIQNGLGEAAQQPEPGWPRYIRTTDISGPDSLNDSNVAALPPALAAGAMLRSGDLLLSAAGTVGISHLYQSGEAACFAGYLVRMRPGARVHPRFVLHWTQSSHFLDQIEVGKVRSTIDNFSAGKYRSMQVPVPPLDVQEQIAEFLDAETARIDALIAKKDRMIGLLTERKRSIVDDLVRRGLDPSVPTMESGIDLVGRVPAHWEVAPLWTQCDFRPGKPHEPFIDDDGEHVCVNSRFVSTEGRTVKWCTENLSPAKRSDILIVMSDLPNGRALGKAYFVCDARSYAVNQRVAIVSPRKMDPRFAYYQLNRSALFLRHDDGSNQTHLPNSVFTKLPLLVPPREEQEAISARLDEVVSSLDRTTSALRRQIDLLVEHRQALITAAVTGELAVPGVAA